MQTIISVLILVLFSVMVVVFLAATPNHIRHKNGAEE